MTSGGVSPEPPRGKLPDTAKIFLRVMSGTTSTGAIVWLAGILARHGSLRLAALVGIAGVIPAMIYVVAANAAGLGLLVKAIGEFVTTLTNRRLHLRHSRDYSKVVKAAVKKPDDGDLRTLLYDLGSMHPILDGDRLEVRAEIRKGDDQPHNDEPGSPPEEPPQLHTV
jgi:hypothetical protein